MRLVRIEVKGNIQYGCIIDGKVHSLEGDIFGEFRQGSLLCSLEEARILAPVVPSKIVAVGLNYRDHAQEVGAALPEEPVIFLKPPTALIGPDDRILFPKMAKRVDPEGELAVVVKKVVRNIKAEDAARYILGYTCANDVTARDLQRKDGQWTRGKSFDTFCPLGPVIATDLDPHNLALETRVNGEITQKSNTSNLIFPVETLVSFISKVMTLLPGDVILTGTPSGIAGINVGDEIEIDIECIGVLRNLVTG